MMQYLSRIVTLVFSITALSIVGCREDETVWPSEAESLPLDFPRNSEYSGMYILNEGNMGSNKCTLDWLNFTSGIYERNIYSQRNPSVVKELGDVGNDLLVHEGRLFAVINCSNKVEVMDAYTGIRLGQVDIPNCRSIIGGEGVVYVSTYVGPVAPGDNSPLGAVVEVDIQSLAIIRQVTVGYQPEQMILKDGMLYVANSGGYRAPHYDNTISVIRLDNFRQIRKIEVAPNLHSMVLDSEGNIWVTSGGNDRDVAPALYRLTQNELNGRYEVALMLPVAVQSMAHHQGKIYTCGKRDGLSTFYVIDCHSGQIESANYLPEELRTAVETPYGIAIHSETGDIFLTDAKNYVSSGTLHCIGADGRLKWSVRTGDIPAHMALLSKPF